MQVQGRQYFAATQSLNYCFRVLFFLLSSTTLLSCTNAEVNWIEIPLQEHVYFDSEMSHRSEAVQIDIEAGEALEYNLEMQRGNSVSYNWVANQLQDTEKLLVEFHGHTIRKEGEPGDLMFYKQGRFGSSSGYLVAPFDGIHAWYFSNESENDISITLNLSGFYKPE